MYVCIDWDWFKEIEEKKSVDRTKNFGVSPARHNAQEVISPMSWNANWLTGVFRSAKHSLYRPVGIKLRRPQKLRSNYEHSAWLTSRASFFVFSLVRGTKVFVGANNWNSSSNYKRHRRRASAKREFGTGRTLDTAYLRKLSFKCPHILAHNMAERIPTNEKLNFYDAIWLIHNASL